MTDLPKGYRWATAEETERINSGENLDSIVVPLTVDSEGNPYTQDEADIAVPIKKSRPNKNFILQVMRDDFGGGDEWGVAMGWAFACAENLAYVGADVPSELGYQMSLGGPVIESHEDFEVAEYLGIVVEGETLMEWRDIPSDADTLARISEVHRAGRILARYLDWLRAAGKDY